MILKQWAPRAIKGSDLLNDCLSNRRFLSTGFPQLDSFLNGGLVTGEIAEIYGISAVGKTQMCHISTAATVISSIASELGEPPPNSLEEIRGPTVLYLDTKGEFDPKRLRSFIRSALKRTYELTEENGLDIYTNHCLSRVYYRLIPTIQNLMDAIVETRFCVASAVTQASTSKGGIQLNSMESKFYSSLRLVIIDCITGPFAPFSSAFPNENNFQLQVLSTELRRLSSDFHIAILVSNNCRYGNDTSRGCLGEFWSNVPRLKLHMLPHNEPLQASVEITRDLRFSDTEVDESSEDKPNSCIVNFREILKE
ncbi:unnamed protein product [Rodentolepis nana]|uniref:RecA family profile 1 domain-containing protein n=1 Tax=Rodentolepis nana TaxID=102285 RepID=A0A3P7VJQ0_RODNA|nr:unnamed protein product [Rodentolepis nana]